MTNEEREKLIKQLQNHGENNTKSLNNNELIELFKKTTMEWTKKFIKFYMEDFSNNNQINFNLEEVEQEMKDEILKSNDLYNSFYILLQKYPVEQIKDSIINNVQEVMIEKSLFILEIKYREYQEILIEIIENKLNLMPKEEAASFMNFIDAKRDDIRLLKNIANQLQNDKIAENINRITNTKKYIISNFLPKDLETNYKQFYRNSTDRQNLVLKLKKISNAYSKKQLDGMTKEDLMDILTSIKQKEYDEKKDKKDFDKYIELFKKALYEDDASTFHALVIQVIEDVNPECLNNIKKTLKERDALFESKFLSAQREWNKFK